MCCIFSITSWRFEVHCRESKQINFSRAASIENYGWMILWQIIFFCYNCSVVGTPQLAQEALAGLASKENFSQVALRKADSFHGTGLGERNRPYKEIMLLHVKGLCFSDGAFDWSCSTIECCLATLTGTRDHITPLCGSMHWLPIKLLIDYKLYVLMHLVRIGRNASYLADMMICPVVRDLDPPTVSDMKPHNWNSSLVSEVFHMLNQRHGTLFHPISRNSRTLILLKNNWKLACLSLPMNDEYDLLMHHWSGVSGIVK